VINAKGIDINVKNLTNPGWKKGDSLSPGDRLEISFDRIKTPLEKIAGIYNPGFPDTCYVKYDSPQGEVRGEGVQYNLSERNTISVTVPASGIVRLHTGIISCGHMGDPLGSHRTRIGKEPVYPNFTAINVEGEYCVMPDITLTGEESGIPDDGSGNGNDNDNGSVAAGGGGGGCSTGTLAVAAMFLPAAVLLGTLKTRKNRR
jgi:hypothetical protein